MGARRIEVLRGISLDISWRSGLSLGCVRCGKTTLFIPCRIEQPESERLNSKAAALRGNWLVQARLRNEKMGFVFQGYCCPNSRLKTSCFRQ
jgi:ABC-type lipoprotein export system ATPase subunit